MISAARILSAAASPVRLVAPALLGPIAVAWLFEPSEAPLLGTRILVPATLPAYLLAALAAVAVWVPVHFAARKQMQEDLLEREAYLAVAIGWLLWAVMASLPFALAGVLRERDAVFEAMSGLTGTGMTSVRAPLETLPVSLLFWRAELQWIGGLAFIVLTVAVLSRLTHGGLQLLRGEATGAGLSRIRPKVAQVAAGLGRLYFALTVVFAALLFVAYAWRLGLPPKDAVLEAVTETFAAYGNGAFTLHLAGPGHTDPVVQALLGLMMVAGATNVTLAFLVVRRGQFRSLVTNPEWRFFLLLLGGLMVGILALVARQGASWGGLRDAAFQVVSLGTGTGLYAVNYDTWPHAALVLILVALLVGGTAGSAAGGIKAFRALLLVKTVGREIRRLVHPRAVIPIRVGRRVVSEETVGAVIAFFFAYLSLWLLGTFLLALVEKDLNVFESSSATLAALGNVAVGFYSIGPATPGTASLGAGKAVLAGLMWIGRMELFAAFLVFTPQSWRN